ncbi:HAMP domain-containing protein [Streptosporangium lutulentum]
MAGRSTSHLTPKARIDLLQLVDSHGRVLAASPEAASRPFMSTLRPPLYDPVQHRTECSPRSGCVVLTALRIPPLETRVFWQGEPHYVLAGTAQPPLLAEHLLELFIAAGVALIAALATWGTWWTVGRALDPVRAIRARMAEITVTDLSLRVPQPPGCDEIAQLAHTANQTLARLEESATYQRHFASVASHELKTRSPACRRSWRRRCCIRTTWIRETPSGRRCPPRNGFGRSSTTCCRSPASKPSPRPRPSRSTSARW